MVILHMEIYKPKPFSEKQLIVLPLKLSHIDQFGFSHELEA